MWENPNKNIQYFRSEKVKDISECQGCNRNICKNVNCRILALYYKQDLKKSNPITCFINNKYKNFKYTNNV